MFKRRWEYIFSDGGNHCVSAGSATQELTHNSNLLVRIVVMMIHTRLDWTHVTDAVSETHTHRSYPSIHNLSPN